MVDPAFHEVERGVSFVTYQGSQSIQRLDWSGTTIRSMYVGYIEGWCASTLCQRMDAMLRTAPNVNLLVDYWEATGYETAFRTDSVAWAKNNPGKITEVHVISRSKILNMVVSVASLAVPAVMVKSYGKRAEFDIFAKKAGLPLNPSMPKLAAPKLV
jgi:hypothetical protein